MNYLSLVAGLTLTLFPAFGFVIEKLAAKGYLPDAIVSEPPSALFF